MIENFKTGGAAKLGVEYEQRQPPTRRVVYCSITGFGSERQPPGRPGYDFVAQAETGLMSITGPEDGAPFKVGVALVDVLAGLHAAVAILAALGGEGGGQIEVPLLDSGLAGLVNVAQNALVTGREPERHGNAHPNIVPYQDFETAGGARIAVAAANDGLFRALCGALGLEPLADEGALRDQRRPGRAPHRADPAAPGALPRAPGRGLARGARRRRRPERQGARRPGRACGRRRGRPAGHADGRPPPRGPARAGGLADLGADRPRDRHAAAAAGGAHGGRARRSSAARTSEIEALAARGVALVP